MNVWKHILRTVLCCMPMVALAQTEVVAPREQALGAAAVVRLRPSGEVSATAPLQRLDTAAFRQRGITSVADALRRFGGVTVRDYGGAGGLKTVSVRGLGATHTAVVLDGLTLSDGRSGQTDLSRFRLDRLASIELHTADEGDLLCPVRQLGAATLVLTSLLPDSTTLPVSGTAALRQVSFGTWHPELSLSFRPDRRTALSLGGDFYHADNDYPFLLRNGRLTHTEHRRNSRMNDGSAEANFRHTLCSGALWTAKASFASSRRYLPGPVLFYTSDNHEHVAERTASVQTLLRGGRGAFRFFGAGKYTWQESRYRDVNAQYPGGALRQDYWQRECYASAGAEWGRKDLTAALAADYACQDMNSNQPTDNDVSRHTWQGSLSLRYSRHRFQTTARLVGTLFRNRAPQNAEAAQGGQRLSPSLSAAWQAVARPRLSLFLRAHYKELFRAPTFTENYYYHYGSTHLRPERSRQGGAGLTFEASSAAWCPLLRFTADFYENTVADKIAGIPVSLYIWRTVNLSRVRATGADFTLHATFLPAPRHALLLTGSCSLLDCIDTSDASGRSYHKQLAYTPPLSGAASVAWENPWVCLSANVTATAHRWTNNEHAATTRLPGYAELGIGLYRTLHLRSLRADLRADLLNVLDRQYEVIGRYPMPGRSYRLAARINF